MASEVFKEYYSKIRNEGLLKALVTGLIFGFSAAALMGLAFWFFDVKQWWIAIIAWFVITAGVGTIAYFKKYRPTTKAMAKRVDALGLEERLLTMTELENDTSYMAMKQREDAKEALANFNKSLLKITLAKSTTIAASIVGVVSAAMVTVSALTAYGYIKPGAEVVSNPSGSEKEYEIKYEVEGEGEIEGDIFQLVKEGEDAEPVSAVAEDGWVFVGWSDGNDGIYRQDVNVTESFTVKAIFEEAGDGDGGDEDDGNGEDQPGQGNGKPSNQPGKPNPNTAQGGEYEQYNQVIDQETYYLAIYEESYDQAMEDCAGLPDDLKAAIGAYFTTIAK